jgi:H/ACA ribonucleoprotein complex non-core subunit NAF1
MLANYSDSGSSSEEEEVNDEIPNYREKSDTEDSESSSSSSDSEEELDMKEIEKKINESSKCDVDTDDDVDDDSKTKKKRDPPKVKGEMLLSDLPPIEDLQITVDEKECLEIGRISTIVEELGEI